MLKKFWDDIYLYNTIKDVTQWTDDEKIEKIWDTLHAKSTWTIMDIEKLMKEAL